jgi:hypothetical protein
MPISMFVFFGVIYFPFCIRETNPQTHADKHLVYTHTQWHRERVLWFVWNQSVYFNNCSINIQHQNYFNLNTACMTVISETMAKKIASHTRLFTIHLLPAFVVSISWDLSICAIYICFLLSRGGSIQHVNIGHGMSYFPIRRWQSTTRISAVTDVRPMHQCIPN